MLGNISAIVFCTSCLAIFSYRFSHFNHQVVWVKFCFNFSPDNYLVVWQTFSFSFSRDNYLTVWQKLSFSFSRDNYLVVWYHGSSLGLVCHHVACLGNTETQEEDPVG